MQQNSLIEIGSKGNVIIRFNSETCINGKVYQANEPYMFLKDVSVIIDYNNAAKSADTDRPIAAYSDIFPVGVRVGGVQFSRRLASLMTTYIERDSNENFKYTVFETKVAEEDGGVYLGLTGTPTEEEKIYVYNKDMELMDIKLDDAGFIVDKEDGETALVEGETYLISFTSVRDGTKFYLNKPHLPYMTLEVQGVGNINKETKNVKMIFDKVSFNSTLNFNFIEDGSINAPLEFVVLKSSQNYVIFED